MGVWRCPAAGLDHLEWESNLKFDDEWTDKANPKYGTPTPQALSASEQKYLYKCWRNVRPNRPDPYDETGWSAFCERRHAARAGGDDDSMAIIRYDFIATSGWQELYFHRTDPSDHRFCQGQSPKVL